jgi:hypothetical protein
MAKRERTAGLLPPIRANFKDAVKAMLGTPLADDVKGARNVKPRTPARRKRPRTPKKAR